MSIFKNFGKKRIESPSVTENNHIPVPIEQDGQEKHSLQIAMTLARSDFLERLVTTKGLSEEAARHTLAHTEFDTGVDSVVLIVLRVENPDELNLLLQNHPTQYIIDAYAAIVEDFSNCMQRKNCSFIYGRSQNDFLCMFGYHQDRTEYGSIVSSISETAKQIIEEKILPSGIRVRFAVSRANTMFSNTEQLYQELSSIFDYCAFVNMQSRIHLAGEFIGHEVNEDDFPELRRLRATIMISIQQRKFDGVREMIGEFLKLQFTDLGCISPNSFRITMFQYTSSFMKACDEALLSVGATRLPSDAYFSSLKRISSLSEFSEFLYDILASVSDACMKSTPKNDTKWISSAIHYISENYQNQDLNASAVAEYLDMSLSHITRTFNAKYGCGLYEYIQQYRVGKAMDLLRKGLSVQEIALQSGFSSVPAMNRAFVKHRGITPSHMNSQQEFKSNEKV